MKRQLMILSLFFAPAITPSFVSAQGCPNPNVACSNSSTAGADEDKPKDPGDDCASALQRIDGMCAPRSFSESQLLDISGAGLSAEKQDRVRDCQSIERNLAQVKQAMDENLYRQTQCRNFASTIGISGLSAKCPGLLERLTQFTSETSKLLSSLGQLSGTTKKLHENLQCRAIEADFTS